MKGIEILFKSGKKDWIDPVDVETDVTTTETHLRIWNGHNTYEYCLNMITRYTTYDLCTVCKADTRSHLSNCPENDGEV